VLLVWKLLRRMKLRLRLPLATRRVTLPPLLPLPTSDLRKPTQ
jgi:hypothetical protein